ncbi:hypothetical protein Tco_0468856 [Tanacetum coccineum]
MICTLAGVLSRTHRAEMEYVPLAGVSPSRNTGHLLVVICSIRLKSNPLIFLKLKRQQWWVGRGNGSGGGMVMMEMEDDDGGEGEVVDGDNNDS